MSNDKLDNMKRPKLAELCRARGLEDTGSVATLRARLRAWKAAQTTEPAQPTGESLPVPEATAPPNPVAASEDPPSAPEATTFEFALYQKNLQYLGDPKWDAENRKLAAKRALQAGHAVTGNARRDRVEGNTVIYAVPVAPSE